MLSHLKCQSCGKEFDYSYVPGVSLTSMRLGNKRYFRCPFCRKRQAFDLTDVIASRHEGERLVDDTKASLVLVAVAVVVIVVVFIVLRVYVL
jgi:DNA-directed RNA polymerase subunit RPC12/RpoP